MTQTINPGPDDVSQLVVNVGRDPPLWLLHLRACLVQLSGGDRHQLARRGLTSRPDLLVLCLCDVLLDLIVLTSLDFSASDPVCCSSGSVMTFISEPLTSFTVLVSMLNADLIGFWLY